MIVYNNDEGTDFDSTHSRQIEVKRVVTETIEIPAGYIRYADAVRRYAGNGLNEPRLSMWLKRTVNGQPKVKKYEVNPRHLYVDESDVRRALGLDP